MTSRDAVTPISFCPIDEDFFPKTKTPQTGKKTETFKGESFSHAKACWTGKSNAVDLLSKEFSRLTVRTTGSFETPYFCSWGTRQKVDAIITPYLHIIVGQEGELQKNLLRLAEKSGITVSFLPENIKLCYSIEFLTVKVLESTKTNSGLSDLVSAHVLHKIKKHELSKIADAIEELFPNFFVEHIVFDSIFQKWCSEFQKKKTVLAQGRGVHFAAEWNYDLSDKQTEKVVLALKAFTEQQHMQQFLQQIDKTPIATAHVLPQFSYTFQLEDFFILWLITSNIMREHKLEESKRDVLHNFLLDKQNEASFLKLKNSYNEIAPEVMSLWISRAPFLRREFRKFKRLRLDYFNSNIGEDLHNFV